MEPTNVMLSTSHSRKGKENEMKEKLFNYIFFLEIVSRASTHRGKRVELSWDGKNLCIVLYKLRITRTYDDDDGEAWQSYRM